MSDGAVLHIKGRVLVGPEEVRDELWVVDGRVAFDRPVHADDVRTITGWVLPGLVDAHCHVGLDAHGAVDEATSEKQALTDRDAGTLLIRDAGSAADTRWIDDREDLPRIVRAGRHIARTRRYIRNYAHEIEPGDLAAFVRHEARRGDGWVKLVGDWIDRDRGDLAACWPADALREAIAAAHEEGARVTAHCFAAESLPDLLAAGIDCVEHGTGLTEELIPVFAERGWRSSRPWSTSRPSRAWPRAASTGSRPGRPTCAGCTSAGTTPSARRTTPASRCTWARTRAARWRTAWWRPRWPSW
ncbi:hypothetical protein GCM10025734_60320 [Kitasatospora paranensis]